MRNINESIENAKMAGNIVSAIADILRGNSPENNTKDSYLGGSISQYTKNLIMTFPVLCDNTLSPQTASMINKANERNVTTMLMLLFTAMNIEANSGMKVISRIHKNISLNMDVYEVMDRMEQIGNDLDKVDGYDFEESGVIDTVKGPYTKESEVIREMMEELKYKKYNKSFPVNSLNENSLDRFTVTRGYKSLIINEAKGGRKLSREEFETNRTIDEILKQNNPEYKQLRDEIISVKTNVATGNIKTGDDALDAYQRVLIRHKDEVEKIISNSSLSNQEKKEEIKKLNDLEDYDLKDQAEIEKNRAAARKSNFDIELARVPKLVDTDVKKANELQPTVLQVNYSERTKEGGFQLRTFLAGIKSRLVAVDSTDIIERIIAKNKTKVNFFNFIRATTGEIKFFRDFIFAIDQAKLDSKNAVKKGPAAKLWNCLSNRASTNNRNKLRKLGNDASAITMLVISQETVNYMKNVHKFDIENIRNTKAICEAYNLMGIMIADESIEVLKSYYVGNNLYEQTAYSFLEKENKGDDYKKMINLIGKFNTR